MDNAEMRIGDTDRESAIAALGEHMSAGRLNIDEYGQRSAQVTAAKTRGELTALFDDLPAPHPSFVPGMAQSAAASAAQSPAGPSPAAPPPPPARRNANQVGKVLMGALPVLVIAIVALVLLTHAGIWFIAIPLLVIFGGGYHHRERRLDRLDRQRERMEDRLDRQRDRMEARFDRHRDRWDYRSRRR